MKAARYKEGDIVNFLDDTGKYCSGKIKRIITHVTLNNLIIYVISSTDSTWDDIRVNENLLAYYDLGELCAI